MPNPKETLLQILREMRALLALPGNHFGVSTWNSAAEALAELDGFISDIEVGCRFDGSRLSLLFAPTSDIQDVSLGSGWGEEFCRVAGRFDSAFAQYEQTGSADTALRAQQA